MTRVMSSEKRMPEEVDVSGGGGGEKAVSDVRRDVPAKVIALACAVRDAGGRALLVGGCVRDRLMGRESKDWDVEVYGIEPAQLRRLLDGFGKVNTVGEAFTVYKIGRTVDVSLPRRERKQGRGHRGFVIEGDSRMSFEEAARRRDFTINAMLQDPLTGELLDPYGGQEDLGRRTLRHVSVETFAEDSLRVLRAAQFAARFDFDIAPETIELCRTIDLSDLPPERVWGEIEKLLLEARTPSVGFRLLAEMRASAQLFPELDNLDARTAHTLTALDLAREQVDSLSYPKRIAVMLAVLCHDLDTDAATLSMLDRLRLFTLEGYDVRAQTAALVSEYKRPQEFYERQADDAAFRRLAIKCELELLYIVAQACAREQAESAELAAPEWFINRARELGVASRPLASLLRGRDLQELGLSPSPLFGRIIAAVYEMQLDGSITNEDEARVAAADMIATNMYD